MSVARTSGGSQLARALTWDTAVLAPIVLVQGAEGLLVDRALDSLGVQSKTADSQTVAFWGTAPRRHR